ncbi:uncharacterized protein PAC_06513 [Phialocephala subalpina]|uniref:Nitrogen regulatory protein areA GATA-like domain-containing protein n=1 Tax=Phialocephala subalpina TaxID=576137 RepID=A0A1L7WV17_9HELO|nr:uncharacterized protein PAC_06513 [Phialocephala subalpina]
MPNADCWHSPFAYTDTDTVTDTYQLTARRITIALLPLATPRTSDSYPVSSTSNSSSSSNSRPESPVPAERVEHTKDDTMVRDQPSRNVDYLCHDWEEEDIWSSWKHIVSIRKAYGNTGRLENALWRAWTKSQYRLKTVPPETLNWLKDSDVSWLYGPLQTSSDKLSTSFKSPAGSRIPQVNSPLNKRPILKKRSASENMLQLSLSVSSLANPLPRRDGSNEFPSVSPTGERHHIHFDEKVEQCIAVDVADGGDDEDGLESYAIDADYDSSSDDGFLMMRGSSKPKVLFQSYQSAFQTSFSTESRTIAILPSTKLKDGEDAPELPELTAKILLDSSDENADVSWSVSSEFANHRKRIPPTDDKLQLNALWEINEGKTHSDVRRTLFGQVVDAVDTAKDIIYFIWNIGW